MNRENKSIIKALNMYGRVPEQWELLEEIERLNNIVNELEKELRAESSYVYFCSANAQKTFKTAEKLIKSIILDKLLKLKGDD